MYLRFVRGKQERQQPPAHNKTVYEETAHIGYISNTSASEANIFQFHHDYDEPNTIGLQARREMDQSNSGLSIQDYQNTLSPRPDRFL